MMRSLKSNSFKLVALHGFLGLPTDWNPFPFIDCPVTIENEELDLWSWARQFNTRFQNHPEKKILIGYSMGGRLGMHALLSSPELWSGAILISAHPGLLSEKERSDRLANDQRWAKRFLCDPWNPLLNEWNNNPVFGTKQFPFPRNENLFDRKKLSCQLLNWSLGKQEPLVEKLNKQNIPILTIAGELDTKFSTLAAESKLMTTIIPGAGHRVPWDQPDAFTRQISQFIEDLTGTH